MKTIVPILLAAIGLFAVAAPQAEAHHGNVVAFRRTPFNPFRGPVPVHSFRQADFFVAPHAFHGVNAFRGYAQPFYSAPASFSYSVPSPLVYAQPAPVVAYTQPAPVVPAGYAPAAYSASQYAAPQAYSAGVTYQLPDGRIVLPNGQVVEPR